MDHYGPDQFTCINRGKCGFWGHQIIPMCSKSLNLSKDAFIKTLLFDVTVCLCLSTSFTGETKDKHSSSFS